MCSARLWSLWDMLEKDAGRLLRLVVFMGASQRLFDGMTDTKRISGLYPPHFAELISDVRELQAVASDLDLPVCRSGCGEALHILEAAQQRPLGKCGIMLEPAEVMLLQDAFRRVVTAQHEADSKMFLGLDAKAAALWGGSPLDSEVEDAFPITATDIEEASKCLAVGRSTACVFHLMRAAEAVGAVLSAKLGGKTQDEKTGEPLTFGGLFMEVSNKVEAMPRGADKDAWLHLRGLMSSLNRGTRTKVAHPGTVYSEQKAQSLFGLTKSFMEEAAELL